MLVWFRAARCLIVGVCGLILALANTARAQTRYTENLPTRFASRTDAQTNGCDFERVEGPAVDTCLLTGFGANQMDVLVFAPAPDLSYRASQRLVVTSWYWGAKLSFLHAAETDWLVIGTEGTRGTGILQHVLLVVAWDGSLQNGCK